MIPRRNAWGSLLFAKQKGYEQERAGKGFWESPSQADACTEGKRQGG
jgi:hypothetical protein